MSMKLVLKEFAEYYHEHANKEREIESSYEDKLRVSSFPYCGLRHAYWRMIQLPDYHNMGADYYTGVGSVTHSAIQHALGFGKRMFGNWECKADGCKGKRVFSNNNRCPACRSVMEYKEFMLDLRNIFPNLSLCFIDGVYRDSSGRYYIVDYKTTNSQTASMSDAQTYLPYAGNVAQIKAYAALIELRFRIHIEGWILHYVARDKPTKVYKTVGGPIGDDEKQLIRNKIEIYSDHYGRVMNCTDFSTIEYLVKHKPCKTVEIYQTEYQMFGGCPLGHICFNRKMLNKELTRAWDEREDDFLTWKRPKRLPLPNTVKNTRKDKTRK